MAKKPGNPFKFWEEVKRRKVHRVLAIYAGTAFIILEAADIILPRLGFPDWTITLILYLLVLGSIVTVIISWIYDITPEGLSRTEPVQLTIDGGNKPSGTDNKLRISNIIIVILIFVVGIMLYPKIFRGNNAPFSGKHRNSIAVLPLKVIGDQADLNFLASGLVESMTYMLTKIGNSQQIFSVIPASEVVESITATEARQRFGATMVITGSLQVEGNTGRIILNLINTKKQQLLRSERVEYKKENNFILQDEAIKVIVDMLGLDNNLLSEWQGRRTGSGSFEANELYLVGRGILREGVERVQDIDAAIDLFNLAIKKDSTFALAYAGIGSANLLKYHFTENPQYIDESLDYSHKAILLNPDDAEVLRSYAGALTDKGEYSIADSIYMLLMDLDSLNPRVYSDLGYLYDIQLKPEIAEKYHLKAVEIDPEDIVALYELAVFYYTQNRYEEAISEMRKAVELAPGHLTILYGLGFCYFGTDNLEEATKTYEKIYSIDSTQSHIIRNLAASYYYLGDLSLSVKYYKKAIEYNPGDYSIYYLLGRSYYLLGNYKDAEKAMRKAISIAIRYPEPDYSRSLATYYAFIGMKDSSYYYLDKCDIHGDPSGQIPSEAFLYGELYLLLEETEKAEEFIESAVERGYGSIEIRYSPFLEHFRNDPGFSSFMAGLKKSLN